MSKNKLPKCNGRPQLWSRSDYYGLRIVWPNGRVEWSDTKAGLWGGGCTSRRTQKAAIRAFFKYDITRFNSPPEFLGYL